MYEVYALAGKHQTNTVIVSRFHEAEKARTRLARTLTRRLAKIEPAKTPEVFTSVRHLARATVETKCRPGRPRKVTVDPAAFDPFA
jgi:hypothetical protein